MDIIILNMPTGQSDSDYGTLKYNTTIAVTRVYWESPDSFWVYHMGGLVSQ